MMNASNSQAFKCPTCQNDAEREQGSRFADIKCIRCGRFLVSLSEGMSSVTSSGQIVRLSGWVREQNAAGNVPIITPDVSRRIENMPLPRYRERALNALKVIATKWPALEGWSTQAKATNDLELLGVSYSVSPDDALTLLHVLNAQHFVALRQDGLFHLTPDGLLAVEALSAPTSASARGFVAMDFAEAMRDVWTNGFDPAIRAAGFRPVRIDAKEYVGGITDEIMSEIRQSRFVVADYTGQRLGVYFEAGFALGLGLTVIPTCRADEIDKLHFDVRHLNTLLWETPSNLADSLAKRLRAVIGVGPNLKQRSGARRT
jgi:hypothetical protein